MTPSNTGTVEILDALMDAFNAHDLDAIMEHFTDDCVFDTARGPDPWGQRLEGKAAVRASFAARFAGMPDVHYAADRQWVSNGLGVSEWLLTGTAADGTPVRVRGCDHWEFRGDRIARKDAYWKVVDPSA